MAARATCGEMRRVRQSRCRAQDMLRSHQAREPFESQAFLSVSLEISGSLNEGGSKLLVQERKGGGKLD